jgi:2-phosphosulfolactate phosphatase
LANSIQTCFSPATYPLFADSDSIVVVVDIFRATSAICTAIHHGVERMIPVASIEEAQKFKDLGFLVAAERNAVMLEGFDFGNSPYHYMTPDVQGKTIAISTTNGTQAIEAAKDAAVIAIGSFLNIQALANWIKPQGRDVIILCAGWKNKFNLEDTLFAGALGGLLLEDDRFSTTCDSTIAAGYLYEKASSDLFGFLENSSHRNRLKNLNLEKDIRYCLSVNTLDIIPVVQDGGIVSVKNLATV